jgi:hypothetical protein
MTRLFGYGRAIPERLRVLPALGLTLVGRTRRLDPHVEPWLGWIATIDRDGLPLRQTWIGFGDDLAGGIYDTAEGSRGAVAVGVLEGGDGRKAFAAGVRTTGLASWIAKYDPPAGTEFFQNDLYVVRPVGEDFVAAGDYDVSLQDPGHLRRPWVLRLTAEGPAPVWQKAYAVNGAKLPTSFHCLWIRPDGLALAGGNIPRGSVAPADRAPFLAVSETEATIDTLVCSQPTGAVAAPLPRRTSIVESIYDRMPAGLLDLPSASFNRSCEVIRICAQDG